MITAFWNITVGTWELKKKTNQTKKQINHARLTYFLVYLTVYLLSDCYLVDCMCLNWSEWIIEACVNSKIVELKFPEVLITFAADLCHGYLQGILRHVSFCGLGISGGEYLVQMFCFFLSPVKFFWSAWSLIFLEQKATNDGTSSCTEDERSKADYPGHGKIGWDGWVRGTRCWT